jgi:hypothetical protein
MAAILEIANNVKADAWWGFKPGPWNSRINVRDFVHLHGRLTPRLSHAQNRLQNIAQTRPELQNAAIGPRHVQIKTQQVATNSNTPQNSTPVREAG